MSGETLSYDGAARRDTPLARKLKERISAHGPLCIANYMDACLHDEEFGYYRTATALGQDGDFVTSPDISQTFGELIGLWCVAVWQSWGERDAFNLVELGAGRGTMLADALRAGRIAPKFLEATHVYIVESNRILREQQKRALEGVGVSVTWLESDVYEPLSEADAATLGMEDKIPEDWLDDDIYVAKAQQIRAGQTLAIANEFFDCLPVSQYVSARDTHPGWLRRRVGLDENGDLQFMAGRFAPAANAPLPNDLRDVDCASQTVPDGSIIETRDIAAGALGELYDLVSWSRDEAHAALFIDYGHLQSGVGDTLQAVRNHAFEHPLTSPGEADLTAHVDFERIASQFRNLSFDVDGPITQGEFLGRLGIVERASKLMASDPGKAGAIEAGVARLIAPTGMGSRFKVLGVRSKELPVLPGFEM